MVIDDDAIRISSCDAEILMLSRSQRATLLLLAHFTKMSRRQAGVFPRVIMNDLPSESTKQDTTRTYNFAKC